MTSRFDSFNDFWPYYVAEHSAPRNRLLHTIGTACLLPIVLAAILVNPWWLLAAPVVAYGFAWVGHYFIEHNRPATFTHPFWSLLGDFKMFWLTLTGRMGPELERAKARYGTPSTQ